MAVEKKASAVKIGLLYTLSNFVVRGMSFLTTPIFTRLMTKSEYGQFSSITSWVNILVTIATLDLYSSVSMAKYDFDDKMNEYLSSSLLFGNLFTLIFYGFVEWKIAWAEKFFGMDRFYIRIVFIYLIFYPALQLLLAKYRIYNEYKNVILVTWINILISIGSQIVLVLLCTNKLLGRILGNYGIVSCVYLFLWLYIIIKGKTFAREYYIYALKLAVPLIPHVLSGVLLNSSDRIMIKSICGDDEAALYSLAYTISIIASVFLSSLNQAWIPWMYDRMETDVYSIKKASRPYTLIFSLGCIGMMLVGPEMVLIFGGSAYYEARYIIPPVVFAVMLQFVYTQYVNIEFYRKMNVWISSATMMATVINIGLNYVFLPVLGYQIAAYTTVAGYLFMVILHYVIVSIKTNDVEIYDIKTHVECMMLVGIFMVIALISYKYNWLRMLLLVVCIVAMCCLIYKRKDDIKERLK